jgi:hypothetical protein
MTRKCSYFLLLTALFCFNFLSFVKADEGMWLPLLLGEKQYERMKELGCKLTPEDIYSLNQACLKDAVVLFGTGCTGVVVSDEGLLLTNHHCGIGNIQAHSTLEHNYLVDGFWAKSKSEELPNPGLKVYFLVRMTDVTERVLSNITGNMPEIERGDKVRQNINEIIRVEPKIQDHGLIVKPVFGGNQYLLFEYEVFTDVRLVGAPPINIGKFGGDTDNWVWPRHTGDFSIYRIYANKYNKPAPFSKDNVPYKPKKVAPVSLRGVKLGDFTMVLGYPGVTEEYIYSGKAGNLVNKVYPLRVALRGKRLNIIADAMKESPEVKIKYTAKYAGIANGWKKWEGAIKGLKRANAIEIIKQREDAYNTWISENKQMGMSSGIIAGFYSTNQEYSEYYNVKDLMDESINSVELMQITASFYSTFIDYPVGDTTCAENKVKKFKTFCRSFFKNYSKEIDSKVFAVAMETYNKESEEAYRTEFFKTEVSRNKNDFSAWASTMFSKSVFCDTLKLFKKLKPESWQKLRNDPAVELYSGFYKLSSLIVLPKLRITGSAMDSLNRVYQWGLMKMNKGMYPDANQTFRIAFGRVEGYKAADAVSYDYYTTVNGILEKEDPAVDDYQVSDVLKDLVKRKDYGEYADSTGEMRVCFSASNHTTGGNSGSPVFNARGELIGLNFDRCWEGTMSDILYDPSQCRNISLDIRYLLFVVDKIAGARHLVDEMKLVR